MIEIDEICKKINKPSTTNKAIIKLFQMLREKIRIKYYEEWKKKPLGMEPSTNGVARVEIDESEIIGNQNKILWMFGMIDRADKEARVFCVMNNRTKENLLHLIKENIYISNESETIGNQNKILCMFGMIDRTDKEASVFCVMGNRTKKKFASYN